MPDSDSLHSAIEDEAQLLEKTRHEKERSQSEYLAAQTHYQDAIRINQAFSDLQNSRQELQQLQLQTPVIKQQQLQLEKANQAALIAGTFSQLSHQRRQVEKTQQQLEQQHTQTQQLESKQQQAHNALVSMQQKAKSLA